MNGVKKRKGFAWLLFMPQLIITLFLIFGVLIGMVQSFGIIPSLGLNDFTFAYYQELLANNQFKHSVIFSLKIALFSATLSTFFGIAWAYFWLIQSELRKWQRMLVRIPIIVPHLVVALFILQLFGRTGIFARLFYAIGLKNAQIWFESILFQSNAWGIILSFMWKEIPFVLFYCFPMIESINGKLGEAAQTLGATPLQGFVKIVIPLARNTILAAFFIIFMFAFGSYELPALLGPTLPKALPVASYEAYIHPDLKQRPMAMAYNGITLLICIIAAITIYLLVVFPRIKNRLFNGKGVAKDAV
ncbi:ABC transporter permease [Facklamia miroungae]|uniref:Putative spermidine/putrescine transport system permease protein n=1 Tax=Facklamia miroungae TaxID=120956 RepID=A0A1G7QMZ2_9LACT|nr:ABC transporter permease subunit [Facklamia miroungae]NKZ29002.1 ABC transporter permease subunit [Facklamia miroungae]SDF99911.1 putative spermidine/putrescine transport system permease protein [Facklamia miroungae]